MSTEKWNAKIQFPSDSNFINRIVGANFGPSASSNNPMLTLTFEVVSPTDAEVGTKTYNIAGVQAKRYYVTEVKDNAEKTENCRARVRELWTLLGLDPESINWDNIDCTPLLGLLVFCQMSPDAEPQRKNPTAAQIEAAKKENKRPEGDIMKHPITGQPLVNYWPQIREIFGLAPSDGVKMAY